MKKIIRFVLAKNNERKKIKQLMKANQQHLQKGTYRIIGAGKRIVFIESKETLAFIDKNLSHMSRDSLVRKMSLGEKLKKQLARWTKFYFADGVEGEGAGTLLMFTRSDDFKIFNFSQKTVTTFLESRTNYMTIKQSYETFHDYFPLTILSFQEEEQSYTESYLDFTPYRDWTEKEVLSGIDAVFSNHKNYFSSLDKTNLTKVSPLLLLDEFKEKVTNQALVQHIENIFHEQQMLDDITWPTVPSHGDLNFNNILLDEKKYYFIDWEDYSQQLFFYDLLNLFFVEAAFSEDYQFLTAYFSGAYNENFTQIFSTFGEIFVANNKQFYLASYICARILSFELHVHGHLIDDIFERYLRVLRSLASDE